MPAISSITTRDQDTIETVEVFRERKGIATYSEALEKLVSRAKEHNLHRQDIEPGALEAQRQPAGTNQT